MISKRDILEALGAEIHEDHFVGGLLVGIGVGAIVGGAVALLMAPKTGIEMRELLSERGGDLLEKAKNRVGKLRQNGGQTEASELGTHDTTPLTR